MISTPFSTLKVLSPLTLALSLSGCAFFSNQAEYDNKKLEEYISGTNFNRTHLSDIKKHLTRKSKLAGDIYRVRVYPYTRPLAEAMIDDQVAALSLTQKDAQKLKDNLIEKYFYKKTCFHFKYEVTRIAKASQLKDWRLEMTDHNGITYKTKWLESSLKKSPVKGHTYIGSIKEPVWTGEGDACTDQKVNLFEDFSIKTIVTYAPFPFSNETELFWQYPVYEYVDGEKVEQKEKNKNFKGYRGW